MNYIKGFRYQLYCIARAIGTPHCVVNNTLTYLIHIDSFRPNLDLFQIYCGTPVKIAKEWNSNRGEEGYESSVLVFTISGGLFNESVMY